MANSNEVNWTDATWQGINESVVKEMNKVRIAQKVFPTTMEDGDPTEVQNEIIDFGNFSIKEGRTLPFIELHLEFSLTSAQVNKEPELNTCKTLARMAAKEIALAEDTIVSQGDLKAFKGGKVASSMTTTGLLEIAEKAKNVIPVAKIAKPKAGIVYGENVFSAVAKGISQLTSNAQAPAYALFLPTNVYADTFVPPSDGSLVTTAERIKPLVEGGYYGTGTLPESKGLLVALGGDPTSLFIGREAKAEFLRKDGSKYIFRVVERIQFVSRDPRALIELEFEV